MGDGQVHDADTDALKNALEAVGTPPTLDTPLGTFDLVDGVPTTDSVTKLYDALDFMRGVDVFLNALPGASLAAMRNGFRSIGLTEPTRLATPTHGPTQEASSSPQTRRPPTGRCFWI